METSNHSKQMELFPHSYLPEDIPANLSVKPGSVEARKMTATSGLKCLESFKNVGQLGCLRKMLVGTLNWASKRCLLTWKVKDTIPRHSILVLWPKMLPIGECESGLLHTPTATANQMSPSMRTRDAGSWGKREMWPTPQAFDAQRGPISEERYQKKLGGPSLISEIQHRQKMWPTPRASEWKDTGPVGSKSHTHMDKRDYLCAKVKDPEQPKGSLNPDWTEHYLMGYPYGWTNLTYQELESESRTEPKD